MGSHQSVRRDKAYCPANEFAGHSANCSLCIKNGRFRVCYFVGHMFCRWRNWGIVSTWKLVSGAQQTCLDSAQLGFSVGMDDHLFFRFLRGRSRGRYGGQRCCPSLLGYAGGFSTLWTPVFFGLRRLRGALLVMLPLWLSVFGATLAMFELDRAAGLAFLPYMIWVTVAAALNYRVAQLNPTVAPRDLSAD